MAEGLVSKFPFSNVTSEMSFICPFKADCRFKSNCFLVGSGTIGGVPSMGVFIRDLSPYLLELRRKPRKTPNG